MKIFGPILTLGLSLPVLYVTSFARVIRGHRGGDLDASINATALYTRGTSVNLTAIHYDPKVEKKFDLWGREIEEIHKKERALRKQLQEHQWNQTFGPDSWRCQSNCNDRNYTEEEGYKKFELWMKKKADIKSKLADLAELKYKNLKSQVRLAYKTTGPTRIEEILEKEFSWLNEQLGAREAVKKDWLTRLRLVDLAEKLHEVDMDAKEKMKQSSWLDGDENVIHKDGRKRHKLRKTLRKKIKKLEVRLKQQGIQPIQHIEGLEDDEGWTFKGWAVEKKADIDTLEEMIEEEKWRYPGYGFGWSEKESKESRGHPVHVVRPDEGETMMVGTVDEWRTVTVHSRS